MRIVAGEFSSRKLETKKGDSTRPTLDKVREAVFSSLGGMFDGGMMLDLYSGSGAVGLEALSRGKEHVYLCDKDRQAIAVIRQNVASLKVESRVTIMPVPASKALNQLAEKNVQFDLVYLDPPYQQQQNEKMMQFMEEHHMICEKGIVVVESLKEDIFPDQIMSLYKYKEAIYGITKISYYRKREEN